MAGWTEAPDLAGKGHEDVMSAVVATDSGKSLTQVSALHEPSCGDADYRSPEAVFCCISLGIDIFKFAVVVVDYFPERRLRRVPPAVETGAGYMVFQRKGHIY